MMKIQHGVFLDRDSIDQNDLDFSTLDASLQTLHYYPHTQPGDLPDYIRDAEVVISNKVVLDRKTIESAKHLKLICVAATGTNNVDIQAAQQQQIAVCNVQHYATSSVVEHVYCLLLNLLRNIPAYMQSVKSGHWQDSEQFCLLDYPIAELSGRVIGIIGYGELGRAVATMAKAFGMHVLVSQRPGGPEVQGRTSLKQVLEQSDIISLHCPLTKQTQNLIDKAALAAMKPGSILINTARGGIVDEQALCAALRSGHLGGAAIDVLSIEPPVEGNPLLDYQANNLIVTPHIAWASRNARQNLINEVAVNIVTYNQGQQRNRIV